MKVGLSEGAWELTLLEAVFLSLTSATCFVDYCAHTLSSQARFIKYAFC